MARIPEAEIERLKRETDLAALVSASGVVLRRHGQDLLGLCPFHDDREPSLVITPEKNLCHCLGACRTGGSAIDWVMKHERVSFRHAVERLRSPGCYARRRGEAAAAGDRARCRGRRAAAAGGHLLPRAAAEESRGL